MHKSHVFNLLLGALVCEVADSAVLNIRGSLTGKQVPDGESESPVPGVSWTKLGIGVGVTLLVVGAAVAAVLHGRKSAEAESNEEGQTLIQNAGEEADYAAMLKTLAQQVASDVGPKLSKGGSIRNVLEARASNFTDKAKNFLLSEMNSTAGAVLNEIEAEEHQLLLEWNHAVEANFPPLSILIAGILSPTTLQMMASHHSIQALTVGLPMFCICVAAIVIDWGAVCSIPTLYVWLYTQTVLSGCMLIGHTCLFFNVRSGKKALDAKTQQIKERIDHTAAGSMTNMKEQVIGNLVLLQEGLIIETGIRQSFWNIIVGVATILWLFTTIWNLVLICGWTFVPGVTAFHPKAEKVAEGDFCGAWMTVLVLRISMLLSVLYFFLNIATVVQFVCDMMIGSSSFADAVLGKAKQLDRNGVGVPVVELLAKAFLLRGGSDTISSRLAVVSHTKKCLEAEKAELEGKLASIKARENALESENEGLEQTIKDSGGGDLAAQCAKIQDEKFDFEEWKEKGKSAIEETQAKAHEMKEATTKDLERLYDKISTAAAYVQNSEAFKAMDRKCHELKDKLNDPEFQKELMDNLNQMKSMAMEATVKAKQLADEAMKEVANPENFKMLQDAAQQAMEKAKVAAEELANAANDPELQKRLQEEAAKAFEKAKEAAHQVADTVQDPELQQKLRDASMEAMSKAQEAALETAAGVKAAAEDPELQKKLKAHF